MSEYIEREALLKDIQEAVVFSVRNAPGAEMRGANKIMERIKCAPAADVVEVKCEPMRVEIKTFDTHYTKHYFCPSCGIEIGSKTFDEKRQFGQGTVLHSNKFPNFCPDCGTKIYLED